MYGMLRVARTSNVLIKTAGRGKENYSCMFSTCQLPATYLLSNEPFSLSSQSGPPSWSADTDEASGIGSVDVAAIFVVVVPLLVAQSRMMFCSASLMS